MKNILLSICYCFFGLQLFAQSEYQLKLRYWNGTTDGKGITDSVVSLKITSKIHPLKNAIVSVRDAKLTDYGESYYYKKKFVLFFTVQNVGDRDVAIYDWSFKAVCPMDNLGRIFDANSMIPLVTPYIPDDIYIVLKPGERKMFFSGETDFFWCLPKDQKSLMQNPKYFQGILACAVIADTSKNEKPEKNLGNFDTESISPSVSDNNLDAEIEKLIQSHNELIQSNKNEEAENVRKLVQEITSIAYPEHIQKVDDKILSPQTNPDADYSDWVFMFSDKAVQMRFKQVKKEGDIGYFSVQFRINFEDRIFCKHHTCLGYLFVFGYPNLDKTYAYKSFKFYNTYKDIYTLKDPIPIRLNFEDGSKRLLKKDGFYYTEPNSTVEKSATYLFYNCADNILSNDPNYHRCKSGSNAFIEANAIIIK
jgi:hypothetical protein